MQTFLCLIKMYWRVGVYLHAFKRHYMEVSVKLHAAAALPPSLFLLCRRLDGWDAEVKMMCLQESIPGRPDP